MSLRLTARQRHARWESIQLAGVKRPPLAQRRRRQARAFALSLVALLLLAAMLRAVARGARHEPLAALAALTVALAVWSAAPVAAEAAITVEALRDLDPRPAPGAAITVTAVVRAAGGGAPAAVELLYAAGVGLQAYASGERALPMAAVAGEAGTYAATLPAGAAQPGAMVRWAVRARDGRGAVARDPPGADPAVDRMYYGTIVSDPSDPTALPVFDLYCADESAPYEIGGDGFDDAAVAAAERAQCSLWLRGRFYDNLVVRRRGTTSLAWPKPNFKVKSSKKEFDIADGYPKLRALNLHSYWDEPSENSWMREVLGWRAMRASGVEALHAYHVHARLNGAYWGLWSLTEDWRRDALEARFPPPAGPNWKAAHEQLSNLRWDLPDLTPGGGGGGRDDEVQWYYTKYVDEEVDEDGRVLELARGVSGGGPRPRAAYLFDALNLPQVVAHMAAQALVLHNDRCAKNFQIYLDRGSGQFSLLPWDLDSAFAIDRGLGGLPSPDYCVLACEQWNSPLACDRHHPQDVAVATPWGALSAQPAAGGGAPPRVAAQSAGRAGGRRLAAAAAGGGANGTAAAPRGRRLLAPSAAVAGAEAAAAALFDNPALPAEYRVPDDVDFTRAPTPTGAPGTFNYLIDAVLAVPRTRAMYLRRLRSLMDGLIATGKLEQMVEDVWREVAAEARRDAAAWANPGSPDAGHEQLVTEQLPLRRAQLFDEYGPGGRVPIIPDTQSEDAAAGVRVAEVAPGGDGGYVAVANPSADEAVDVSGWTLAGGGARFTFRAGTVVPPRDAVHVAATSVGSFKARYGGRGLFVVGPLGAAVPGGATFTLSRG